MNKPQNHWVGRFYVGDKLIHNSSDVSRPFRWGEFMQWVHDFLLKNWTMFLRDTEVLWFNKWRSYVPSPYPPGLKLAYSMVKNTWYVTSCEQDEGQNHGRTNFLSVGMMSRRLYPANPWHYYSIRCSKFISTMAIKLKEGYIILM